MVLSLGLIGYPINHSLSPWIHTHFMEQLGIDGEYQLFETSPEKLEETINSLKNKGVAGFNITVPYKQAIMDYVDELDPDAEKIGAVNTVVNVNGKWKGYNTDGLGYVQSVKESFPELFKPNNRVLILGAGGAARGIYRSLVQEPFQKVDLANRTMEKAEQLLELKEADVETNVLSFSEAENRLGNYDFIVQTTSVGMKPHTENQVISMERLKPNTVVSDIVYQPLLTKILKEASEKQGRVHQGHAMLLYQAQLAFQIWTDQKVILGDILKQLEERLRGNV